MGVGESESECKRGSVRKFYESAIKAVRDIVRNVVRKVVREVM